MADLGPIEYIVLGFDGTRLAGDTAPALVDLLETGMIRIVDLAVVSRDPNGVVCIRETEELGPEMAAAFAKLPGSVPGLLSEADLEELGNELAPDSTALAMLVEHLWATRFGSAVRAAGGRLVLSERIPHAVVEQARASLASTASS
ncbi:MAG TPA: DUF6325 family protein [Amaricoccus sp.]|uniref:DUF6325 family protein n=1 Tax=Amaricoccus sp. TaxID=1872485 RepID=UPI002CAC00E7|nr:DUF6325 family protein [Amaricoccus sp.]HMQ94016.1 DUF6325 family protein [Amaricoccus sp.]HMR53239.1 DUF6325 family protein [Amaricoccus sp.]HMR61123.1 DUF6325 family protein [Amaricoccus sp.]HMU00172.1 DUF6325 family protein [Amaricoccus sp.]